MAAGNASQTTLVQIMHCFRVVLYYTNHAACTILIPVKVLCVY